MTASLRLVYPTRGAPAAAPVTEVLPTADALEPYLRAHLDEGLDGEITLREGTNTARICMFEGKIPWVRFEAYPEHLGDVLRRELGLPDAQLRRAIDHCHRHGMRLGEGLLSLGLVRPLELRECLWRHVSDQLWEILTWAGPVTAQALGWPHRYDHAFTFELDELLRRQSVPPPEEHARLLALVETCRQRVPSLRLACVVGREEGAPVCGLADGDADARDLLGLCLVQVRRLVAHRITSSDGEPQSLVLAAGDACLVMQELSWSAEWLLLLGGHGPTGRMLAVAQSVARAL
jgi:hypothetical protein